MRGGGSLSIIFCNIRDCLKNPAVFLCGFYITLMNLPVFLFGTLWGSLYVEKLHHISSVIATLIASMLFIGIMVGSPAMGFISERFFVRKKTCLVFSAIFSFFIIGMLMGTVSNNFYWLSFLFFLLGFSSSAQCLGYPLIVNSIDEALTATATSIASVLIMGIGVVCKMLYGWILDYSAVLNNASLHFYSAHAFQVATLILPVAFLLASGVALLIRENTR